MGKTYFETVEIEPEVREQLGRLTSKEKIFVAELAGLSRKTIYNCVSAKKFRYGSYVKIKLALNVFLNGDCSSELAQAKTKVDGDVLADERTKVSLAAFKLDLKFACKTPDVSNRIEAEYFVNPALAMLMLREAETIEDCNAILDVHFRCHGVAGSSSLTRLENEC